MVGDIGPNFYATQSWENTNTGDGRRVQAAWIRGSRFPGMPFSQQVSFPCELTLHETAEGLRLFRKPIREVESLAAGTTTTATLAIRANQTVDLKSAGRLLRLQLDVDIPAGASLEFNLYGASFSVGRQTLTNGGANGKATKPIRSLEVLLDRGSLEVYANEGEISSTRFVLPDEDRMTAKATGGDVKITNLRITELKSIW
jgi:levanase/fructan beta-fructosidase